MIHKALTNWAGQTDDVAGVPATATSSSLTTMQTRKRDELFYESQRKVI